MGREHHGAIVLLLAAGFGGGFACSSSSGISGGADAGAAAGAGGAAGAVASGAGGAGGTAGAAGTASDGGASSTTANAQCPQPSTAATWTTVAIASARAPIDVVSSWAATSNDVWLAATGAHTTGPTTVVQDDQIQHWDGTKWTTSLDGFPNNLFFSTYGFGAGDVWATGNRAMHWNGSAWTDESPPPAPGLISLSPSGTLRLKPVWGVSGSDVWTVDNGRFLHWNGSAWSEAPVTPPIGVGGFFMGGIWGATSADVWALGSFPASHPFLGIVHWNGTTWTVLVGVPATGYTGEQAQVSGVWGSAANDIWAVGFSFSGSPIWHYDGTAWTHFATPSFNGQLAAVFGFCSSDVWAVGAELPAGQSTVEQQVGIVLHYDGQAWTRVDLGMTVPALSTVSGVSSDDLWVGGTSGTMVHRHL